MPPKSVKKTIKEKRSEGQKKYENFLEAYRAAYPELKTITQFNRANEEYPRLKDDENLLNQRLIELKINKQNSLSSAMSNFASMFAKQKAKADGSQASSSAAAATVRSE